MAQDKVGKIYFNKQSKAAWKILSYDETTHKYLCELVNMTPDKYTKELEMYIGKKVEYSDADIWDNPHTPNWIFVDSEEAVKALYGTRL